MGNNYFWALNEYYNQIGGVAMGARYAPSVANITLNKWESETIFKNRPHSLLLYKRYIDDVMILWEGTKESFNKFLESMNMNKYNLKFTAEYSLATVNYLDLTLFKQGDHISTKTFFKETDRNAYVPTHSCHHPQWIGAVPKGQYMRIRRNCANILDYFTQAAILTTRFREKGYPAHILTKLVSQVANMDRQSLLVPKPKKEYKGDCAFISGFHRQYKTVEGIFKKFWPILLKDKDLQSSLPNKPKFIYRRAPTLRNRLAPNVPDPPGKPPTFLDGSGFHYCTRCNACKITRKPGTKKKKTQFQSIVTQQQFDIKPLITCDSDHVTYVLECPCSLQYVGRTTRQLKVRINEHLTNIKKGYPNHSVSRHFKLYHDSDPSLCTFYGIDKISRDWRGTHMKRAISRNETYWLYKLRTMQPHGMNIDLDLNCFLTND